MSAVYSPQWSRFLPESVLVFTRMLWLNVHVNWIFRLLKLWTVGQLYWSFSLNIPLYVFFSSLNFSPPSVKTNAGTCYEVSQPRLSFQTATHPRHRTAQPTWRTVLSTFMSSQTPMVSLYLSDWQERDIMPSRCASVRTDTIFNGHIKYFSCLFSYTIPSKPTKITRLGLFFAVYLKTTVLLLLIYKSYGLPMKVLDSK